MRRLLLFQLLLLAQACHERSAPDAVARAEFGVLYGGQIQERNELPFELNPAKQIQGFRLELDRPATADRSLEWEISMPGPPPGSRHEASAVGKGRITQLGRGVLRAGERRFEHVLRLKPGDPLGLWNIRVVMDKQVVIDRPFTIYDPVARARATPPDDGTR